jgi:hypothetical protein
MGAAEEILATWEAVEAAAVPGRLRETARWACPRAEGRTSLGEGTCVDVVRFAQARSRVHTSAEPGTPARSTAGAVLDRGSVDSLDVVTGIQRLHAASRSCAVLEGCMGPPADAGVLVRGRWDEMR